MPGMSQTEKLRLCSRIDKYGAAEYHEHVRQRRLKGLVYPWDVFYLCFYIKVS